MKNTSTVHYSNRLETLYCKLKDSLFSSALPFTKRLIIVPSPLMKSWLMRQLAEDTDLNIAMGLEVVQIDKAIEKLNQLFNSSSHLSSTRFSAQELSLLIEAEIRDLSEAYQFESAEMKQIWDPLLRYLKIQPNQKFSKKTQKRLVNLALKIGRYFEAYGIYGHAVCDHWEIQAELGWQEELWKRIVLHREWKYTSKTLLENFNLSECKNWQIDFFAMSFFPKIYLSYFEKISLNVPINFYHLSPCQHFWSDIKSDRESAHFQRMLSKKGVRVEQQIELEEYLRERNPILANFGRLGREMAEGYESASMNSSDCYSLPESIFHHPVYEALIGPELLMEVSHREVSLLDALQSDLLFMHRPKKPNQIYFSAYDQSLSFHAAPSKKREVEILYHQLLRLIEKHQQLNDPIAPSDIVVMAPDMAQYAPYIKAVFDRSDSQLDYQIYDLKASSQSSITSAFKLLIDLNDSRWEISKVIELFELPDFQRALSIRPEEVSDWKKWIVKSGILWGESVKHRNEILLRDGCRNEAYDSTSYGTWEYGLDNLIQTTMMTSHSVGEDSENFDSSKSESLGKLLLLVRSLRNDLQVLSEKVEMSLSDWAAYLNCLIETYLGANLGEEEAGLKECTAALHQAGQKIPEAHFSWISIKQRIEKLLDQKSYCYREARLNTVRFCSLLPMRAIPAKIIALIGMDDESFPRQTEQSSLNLLQKDKRSDYQPSVTDFDRYLFLEAILSARTYLMFSYVQKKQELQPSVVIAELLSYLDEAYTIAGRPASDFCCYSHPSDGFNYKYFDGTSEMYKSYSANDYRLALAYYKSLKEPAHHFVPEFIHSLSPEAERSIELSSVIDLKHLLQAAKNPIQTYFKHAMDFRLPEEEELLPNEENFAINHLDLYIYRKESLHVPVQNLLLAKEKEGKLPPGLLKKAVTTGIQREINSLHTALEKQKIKSTFTIELHQLCKHPVQVSEQLWQFPAYELNDGNQQFVMIGRIENLTSEGLLEFGEKNLKSLYRRLPVILLLNCLARKHPDNASFKKNVIFYKDSSASSMSIDMEEPEPWLLKFIHYYQRIQTTISPLHADWISNIQKGNHHKNLQMADDSFSGSFDHHLSWIIDAKNAGSVNDEFFMKWKLEFESLIPAEFAFMLDVKSREKS